MFVCVRVCLQKCLDACSREYSCVCFLGRVYVVCGLCDCVHGLLAVVSELDSLSLSVVWQSVCLRCAFAGFIACSCDYLLFSLFLLYVRLCVCLLACVLAHLLACLFVCFVVCYVCMLCCLFVVG